MLSWDDIWKILVSVLVSLGGISGIIVFVVKTSADQIVKRLEASYALKLDKELEKYKVVLENKNYISKTKFDVEFSIYRELSKSFSDAVKAVSIMIPAGYTTVPADSEDRKKYEENNYQNALNAVVIAQDTLKSNIPFISKDIYEAYKDILSNCNMQITTFADRWNVGIIGHEFGKSTLTTEDYKRTREINQKFDSLNEKIRDYIAKLDVIE